MSAEHVIKELLNELNDITGELIIILDDFHLIELPDIHHSLSYLLEHLPPHIHLYIASRTDLPIPITFRRGENSFDARRLKVEARNLNRSRECLFVMPLVHMLGFTFQLIFDFWS